MDRWAVVAFALGIGLLAGPGCSGVSRRNPFEEAAYPDKKRQSSETARSKSSAAEAKEALTRKPDDVLADPESRSYLEDELRDATPEERMALMQTLQGKSPEMARDILTARRVGRNTAHKDKPAIAPDRGPKTSHDLNLQASAWSAAKPEPSPSAPASRTKPATEPPGHSTAALPPSAPSESAATDPAAKKLPDILVPNEYALRPGPTAEMNRPPAADAFPEPTITPAEEVRTASVSTLPVLADADPASDSPVIHAHAEATPGETPPLTLAGTGTEVAMDWRKSPEFLRLVDRVAQETLAMKPSEDGVNDEYVRQHAHLRMLYLMGGQSERAVESIPGIEAADQMFWQQAFWGMHNYFDAQNIQSPDERAAQTVQQFTNAAQRLQEKASLKLRNVTFCQQISSFGSYERFPQLEFAPGQQVLLYAEVDNFHSEETDNGQQFRTVLKSTVEIYRAGMPGDPQKIELPVPATEDISRNRRRDYFHTYEFVIPPRLHPGPHVLRLTVEDTLTKKLATATVNFTVK